MINQSLVILAGGRGSRISKYTKYIPKPLLKINNITFLDYLLNFYAKFNFKNIYILVGYKSRFFKKYNNRKNSLSIIKCIAEKEKLDTGGALLQIKKKLNDNFFLINGDSFFEYDFFKFAKHKISKNTYGKIILLNNKNYKSNNKLSNLKVKKSKIIFGGKLMNGGVYHLKPNILKLIKKKKSLEKDIFPELIKKHKLDGYYQNTKFIDIGTYKNLKKSNTFFKDKKNISAVFFDRDGVINYDKKYVHKINDLEFRPGAIKAIKFLNKNNIKVFIVTNQAGIAKNKFSEKTYLDFQRTYIDILNKQNAIIDEIIYCPFHPFAKLEKYKKKSQYRKPGNLMIKKLINKWDVNTSSSFMIGDQKKDLLAAKKSNLYFEYAEKNLLLQVKRICKKINNYF
jgi:D-glycero-D-manno-heptose 1,7-bisphosphate phosphatase